MTTDDLLVQLYRARQAKNAAKREVVAAAERLGNCEGCGDEWHACWASKRPQEQWCDICKEKLPLWQDYRKKVASAAASLRAVLKRGKELDK